LRDRTARRAVATSSAGDAGLAMLCVIGALALAWMFTYGAGGSKTVFPHAFYVPVVMTAIRFRARGALIMSVVAGLAAGPLMPLDVAARTAQPTLNWAGRMLFFFTPHQHRRPTERGQIHQRHLRAVLHPRPGPASPTAHGPGGRLDIDPHRPTRLIVDGEDMHVGQADKQRAHARSVRLHGGSGGLAGVGTADSPGPRATTGGPPLHPHTPLRSEAPDQLTRSIPARRTCTQRGSFVRIPARMDFGVMPRRCARSTDVTSRSLRARSRSPAQGYQSRYIRFGLASLTLRSTSLGRSGTMRAWESFVGPGLGTNHASR